MSAKRKDSKGRILRNGEVQRSDGKYMFRYVDSLGRRQTIYSWRLVSTDKTPGGKRSERPLRDLEKEILRDIEDGIQTEDAESVTVNKLFEEFMDLRKDLRETTRCNYLVLYNKHVRAQLGDRVVGKVKYSDIQKLYMSMVKEKGLKSSTVQSVHALLYQMFETAVMDQIIRINPTANVLKSIRKIFSGDQKERHALTEEQQCALINFVYESKVYRRYGPLITVLLGTGMRIGEALGLQWDNCDFKNGVITVDHALLYKMGETRGYHYRISKPKTSAGTRIIPMFEDVKTALMQEKSKPRHGAEFVVDGQTGFVFLNKNGRVYTPGAVFTMLQNVTGAYNKKETEAAEREGRAPCLLPKFSPHILRHTFCTRLCENEPNIKIVQDVMGHKNVRTTMDVYNEAMYTKKVASFAELEGKIKLA